MKVKIERIHYASLRNNEYPVVVEQTIGIVRKYNPADIHLGKSFEELDAFSPTLQAMEVFVRKNAKLTAVGLLDSERDTLINAFYKVVKGFEDVELPTVKPRYDALNALLEKHKAKTIAADSRASETERIAMFEKDIAGNTDLRNAIQAFGLQDVVARLFEANKEYDSIFREYIAEKSVEEKIDIPVLRRACNKALGQFFDAVQYCAFEHENVDYSGLVKELNKLQVYYKQQLKARATRRKNGKNVDAEEPIAPPK